MKKTGSSDHNQNIKVVCLIKPDAIITIGGGGHAVSLSDVILSDGRFTLAGFLDQDAKASLAQYNYLHLGDDDAIDAFVNEGYAMAIGIGQIRSAKPRRKIYDRLKKSAAHLPSLIAKTAYAAQDVELGECCTVFHHSVINRGSSIGANSIINTRAVIEHNATIGRHCHIAPNACVLGDATINNGSFIGAGAVILQGVTVGADAVIGAGVVVKKDVAPREVVR